MAGATVAIALTMPALVACTTGNHHDTATESCLNAPSTPTMKIALNTIHANVWNAGGKAGQAASVASQLTWRGVHVIDTGNDPKGGQPPKHAEIRYGANGKQIALTLAQQIKDAKLEQDDRTNPSVDVVIGEKFALVPVPPPKPSKVTVNVLNAFVIPGTAGQLSALLTKRGFHVAKVGNTSDFYPDHAVIIRYGTQGEPAARRAALQFKDVRMLNDHRKGTKVDVVIGSKWKDSAIVPVAKATVPPKSPSPTSSKCATTPTASSSS
ncbi:LytR C-terminal domain-containing protein [Flexivirga endophytica]|uniref:LytR C-terminal domain-containing protein n=1 Tax=Flexivirga endophytica TaxID=1849103 RepID=UPI0016664DE6|nr:LytR C-terminal domain-containing protein [Flexivirga endophytica]